jgi:hypothetical protein
MTETYGKLVDGRFVKAPKRIKWHHSWVINPRPEKLIELGYKPLVVEPYPEEELPENFYWQMVYEEDENNIYRKWEKVEIIDSAE